MTDTMLHLNDVSDKYSTDDTTSNEPKPLPIADQIRAYTGVGLVLAFGFTVAMILIWIGRDKERKFSVREQLFTNVGSGMMGFMSGILFIMLVHLIFPYGASVGPWEKIKAMGGVGF